MVYRHPFLRYTSLEPGDMLADSALEVLMAHGAGGLNLTSMAKRLKVTRQALLARWGSRERAYRVIAVRFTTRMQEWAVPRILDVPEPVRLPRFPDEVVSLRALEAWSHLARAEAVAGDQRLVEELEKVRAEERAYLRAWTRSRAGVAPPTSEVAAVQALVVGLRSELVRPDPVLTYPDAVAALDTRLAALVAGAPDSLAP